jgi:hypothetical protein
MRFLSKSLIVLLLIFFATSSFATVKPSFAQSTPKPSIPEFTLSFDKHSSDIPATYTIDPYTGQQQVSSPAKHYDWQTINVTIRNQPFTPYKLTIGTNIVDASLYYNVRFKGAFENDWGYFDPTYYEVQDKSRSVTTITFLVGANGPNGESGEGDPRFLERLSADTGGQVDFQVEALSGYVQSGSLGKSPASYFDVWTPGTFSGTESGWSDTQTITIPSDTGSILTTPKPTMPFIPITPPSINSNGSTQITIQLSSTNLLLLVGIISVVVLAVVTVILLSIRHQKTVNLKQ